MPGQTTQDKALDLLSQSPYVRQNSIRRFYETRDNNTITWFSKIDKMSGNSLMIYNNTVMFIDVALDFQMSVGQLIDKSGPPDKVIAAPMTDGSKTVIRIYLLYLRQGFEAVLSDFNALKPAELSKNTLVVRAHYFPPTSTLEELQRDTLRNPQSTVEFYVRHSYDWTGYGPVKIMQP